MTSRKLKNYIEGQGCKCYAHNSSECGCNVDWTPKEVYELREDLEFRRQLYKVQAAQLDKIRSERDEAQDAIAGWDNKWKCAVEMAARAENERDSLQVALEEKYVEYDQLFDEAEKIRIERDEARTELEMWHDGNIIHLFHRDELEKTERERDEARGALMKIEDLFVDGTDVYADREKMGMIARTALEGAK